MKREHQSLIHKQETEIPVRDSIMENSMDLPAFEDFYDGMKDAVNKQLQNKEEL